MFRTIVSQQDERRPMNEMALLQKFLLLRGEVVAKAKEQLGGVPDALASTGDVDKVMTATFDAATIIGLPDFGYLRSSGVDNAARRLVREWKREMAPPPQRQFIVRGFMPQTSTRTRYAGETL